MTEGRNAAQDRFANRFFTLVLGIWPGTVLILAGTKVNFGYWMSVLQFALWFVSFITTPFILYHYCGPLAWAPPCGDGGSRGLLQDARLRTGLDLLTGSH